MNLECFPIRVVAGRDKQIVGLVLTVAATIHCNGMMMQLDEIFLNQQILLNKHFFLNQNFTHSILQRKKKHKWQVLFIFSTLGVPETSFFSVAKELLTLYR